MAIWDPLESLYQAHPINTDPTYYTCFCYVVGGAITLAIANTTNSVFHIHIFPTANSLDFAISAKTRIVAIIAAPYFEGKPSVSITIFLNNWL